MAGTICRVCGTRKGKRNCPGHGGLICTACCGQERARGFACPGECPHLDQGQQFQATRDEARHWSRLRDRLQGFAYAHLGLEDLLEGLERVIRRVEHQTGRLNDRDVRQGLERWLADLAPADELFQGAAPPSPPATQPGRLLLDSLREAYPDEEWPERSRARLVRGIKRILLSVVDHHDPAEPAAYLKFIREYLPAVDDGDDDAEDRESPDVFGGDDPEDLETMLEGQIPDAGEQRAYLLEAFDGEEPSLDSLVLEKYEIRFQPPIPGLIDRNPPPLVRHPEVRDLLETDPAAARRMLEKWLADYPGNPVLVHFLGQLAGAGGDEAEAARLAEENYRACPDYLFARCDWAMALMRADRDQEVPGVVGGGFLLPRIFPGRKVFHVSELVAVCQVASRYYARQQKPAVAKRFLDLVRQVEPDHPLLHTEESYALSLFSRLKASFRRLFGRPGTDDRRQATGTDGHDPD
ncbi:MAG: hypothetical protein GX442_24535 [Candidatus Riflebacteria bacterium]|nr:hypothetical protein [Candidatus Riflebacteria bacterium]